MPDHAPSQGNLDNLKPEFVSGAEIIDFNADVKYLCNQNTGDSLKLTADEAEVIQSVQGGKSLSDILQNQLETSGTGNFKSIFDLLIKLNNRGFLTGQSAAQLHTGERSGSKKGLAPFVKSLYGMGSIKLFQLPFKFNSPFRYLAGILANPVLLILLTIAGIAGFILFPYASEQNIFQILPVAAADAPAMEYAAYFVSLLCVWGCFSIVLSLRNIFSAWFLGHHQCRVHGPAIKFYYTLIVFDVNLDGIVKAGPGPVKQLFSARVLLPVTLALASHVVNVIFYRQSVLTLISYTCLIIFFFSISPLFNTDLNRALGYLYTDRGNLGRFYSYLKKRFLLDLFSIGRKVKNQNYYLVMSVYSIAWLYFVYAFLWSRIQSSLMYMMSDIISGPAWGGAVILVCSALILLPMLGLMVSFFIIGFSNVGSAVRSPLYRMSKLAGEINKREVPAREHVLNFLSEIPLFSNLEDSELQILCHHLRIKRFAPHRNVVLQGTRGDTFYVIVSGMASVLLEDSMGSSQELDILGTGDSFGEIALVEDSPRTATVRTLTPSLMFELDKKFFDEFVVKSAGGKDKITDMIRTSKIIVNMKVFDTLTPGQVSALVSKFKEQKFEKGDTIFNQGDSGNRFYVIKEGDVDILHSDGDQVTLRKKISKGGFFGEIALIKNVPRTATVTVQNDVHVLYLEREDFFDIIKHNLLAGVDVDTVAADRLTDIAEKAEEACL